MSSNRLHGSPTQVTSALIQQVEDWLLEDPAHTITNLTRALGISRQAWYSGRDRLSFSRRTAAGIDAITGVPMESAEDAEIRRYTKECASEWRKILEEY